MATKKPKAHQHTAPIEFCRADRVDLAKFDPATKRCTMNCGPHAADPRSDKERKFLCDDCDANWISAPAVKQHWESGYFCAVAVALREEGNPSTAIRSMFDQGGGAREAVKADPSDQDLFRVHGLMPVAGAQ